MTFDRESGLTCPHKQHHNDDEDFPRSQLLVFLRHLLHCHLICTRAKRHCETPNPAQSLLQERPRPQSGAENLRLLRALNEDLGRNFLPVRVGRAWNEFPRAAASLEVSKSNLEEPGLVEMSFPWQGMELDEFYVFTNPNQSGVPGLIL